MALRPTPPISPSSRARDHRGELGVESPVWHRAFDDPQVDGGQLPGAEAAQVVLDAAAQLIRFVVGQPAAGRVAACADLAHQREGARVGVQGLADELVGNVRPVVLRGIDMVHAQFHRTPQHRQGPGTVTRRAETPDRATASRQSRCEIPGKGRAGSVAWADLKERRMPPERLGPDQKRPMPR